MGLQIQKDFDNFLTDLKRENVKFRTGGVVAINKTPLVFISNMPHKDQKDYLLNVRVTIVNLLEAAIIQNVQSISIVFPDIDMETARILVFYIAYICHMPRKIMTDLLEIKLVCSNGNNDNGSGAGSADQQQAVCV